MAVAWQPATADHTPVASFRTFPQGVWFDMTTGWDAPPCAGG